MKTILKRTIAFCGVMAMAGALTTPAMAHTGGSVSGLSAGMLHPVLGVDHLLAMVAVGVWSATQPANRAWHGPAMFVAMLAAGAIFGLAGLSAGFVEPGILASVVVLGLMIAAARIVAPAVGLAAIGGFALLHGHAHGSEAVGAIAGYMAGFMSASAALHLAGYGVGRAVTGLKYGLLASGLAISAAGMALISG